MDCPAALRLLAVTTKVVVMGEEDQAMIERRFRSDLLASPDDVWRAATSMGGINAELMPLMAMHSPDGIEYLTELVTSEGIASVDVTIRLGGVLPIGGATIQLVELGEFRFVERSNQPGMRFWQHEREVVPSAEGCTVVDHLTFEPRSITPISTYFVELLFKHRHRRLRARWGEALSPSL